MEYDGTFKNKRPLDLDWITETARHHEREYDETGFISFGPDMSVQVRDYALQQVAHPDEWVWINRNDDKYPHKASVICSSVLFYAIFTEEEAMKYHGQATR